MTNSKITVDLRQRSFTIEVSEDQLDNVLDRIAALFQQEAPGADSDEAVKKSDEEGEVERNSPDALSAKQSEIKTEKKRGRKASAAKSWELVDLQLDVEQRKSIRDFFESKNPKSQNDSIAVLIFKLKEITGKSTFNGNEIHSALKLVAKPTPKNMYAVFSNMKTAGIASVADNQLVCNSLTEDYVNFHMKIEKDKK